MIKGRKGKRVIVFVMVLALMLLAVFGVIKMCAKVQKYSYNRTGSVLYNPFIGFAPNADYLEAVGDNRLVYVDVTWKELEPEEGKFDFESIYVLDRMFSKHLECQILPVLLALFHLDV